MPDAATAKCFWVMQISILPHQCTTAAAAPPPHPPRTHSQIKALNGSPNVTSAAAAGCFWVTYNWHTDLLLLLLLVQIKALGGSLILTGAAAAGCFWLMQDLGLVNPDIPTSSRTLATAWDMMLRPQAVQQQAQQELQQQQQQQQSQQHIHKS